MRNIKLTIQYDGTNYHGWQMQKNGSTIQEVIEGKILSLTGQRPKLIGAGRTDAGVHALAQAASFKTETPLNGKTIKKALNAMLPDDIMIVDVSDVDISFHARYSAAGKTYSYYIADKTAAPVFLRRFVWRFPLKLDVEAMNRACLLLRGIHDFSAFRGSGCGSKTSVKKISEIRVENTGEFNFLSSVFSGDLIKITVEADGFLRHMVRNIAGTLVETGRGRMAPEAVYEIMESKDRRLAGPTAPAKGLFLEKVIYKT